MKGCQFSFYFILLYFIGFPIHISHLLREQLIGPQTAAPSPAVWGQFFQGYAQNHNANVEEVHKTQLAYAFYKKSEPKCGGPEHRCFWDIRYRVWIICVEVMCSLDFRKDHTHMLWKSLCSWCCLFFCFVLFLFRRSKKFSEHCIKRGVRPIFKDGFRNQSTVRQKWYVGVRGWENTKESHDRNDILRGKTPNF